MIVEGMSEREITKEVLDDFQNAIQYVNVKQSIFRRMVIKSKHFPLFHHFLYTSPRNNKWIILLEARNKKEVCDKCGVTYIATHNTNNGIHCYLVTILNGRRRLCIHPSHFFSRYKKRNNLEIHGLDLILDFFKNCTGCVFKTFKKDSETTSIFGTSGNGIVLGVTTSEGNQLIKTYITKDMLKGEQIENFNRIEYIRNEVYDKGELDKYSWI